MTVRTIEVPRKGELKGGRLKIPREEVTRQTGLVVPCSPRCTVLKDTVPTSYPSNKTPAEDKEKISLYDK